MAKTKQCSFCKKDVPKLFYANPKCCPDFSCRRAYSESKPNKGTNVPIRKKQSKITPISDKMKKNLVLYRKLRDEYMKNNPVCEWCKVKPSQDLHHRKPRAYYLCDISVFSALCRSCHDRCETDHEAARKAGFKLNHL